MKNLPVLLLVVTLFFGCRTQPPQNESSGLPASHITLTVTCGDPAMKFTGTIFHDGHTKYVSGTGRGTYHITGYEIVASFKKSGADGRISLEGSDKGGRLGYTSTDRNGGGVVAEFHRTPTVQQGFSSF